MTFHEIEMDDDLPEVQPTSDQGDEPDQESEEIVKLRGEYQSRLVVANLRTEAVRAGMVDLDGLRLIDTSSVRLGNDDKIIVIAHPGRRLLPSPPTFAPLRRHVG
jgi:hypothetical protein